MQKQNTRKQQSFLHGSLILVASTALVKIIGAIYKIPLGNILGGDGGGYFSTAYDLYLPIYSLSMAGLPIAVSRMVAESVASHRYKDTRQIMRIARKSFLVTGFSSFLIMLAAIYPYILITNKASSVWALLAIAPSILFCCIMSSYRGYYEGLRNMYPTAISSVIETLGKLFIGLGLAYAIKWMCLNEFARSGTVFGQKILPDGRGTRLSDLASIAMMPYVAAGAIAGITLGAAIGAAYLVIRHKVVGDKISPQELKLSAEANPWRQNFKLLISIAIPVVLGSMVTEIAGLVDLTTVQARLAHSVSQNPALIREMYNGSLKVGLTDGKIPNFLYGCYKMYAYSIYNLVPGITSVMGVSAIPVLATAWAQKSRISIRVNIESILRMASMIAIPAGIGIMVMAKPILSLLYSGSPGEVNIAAPMLSVLGLASILAGLTIPITSMLQAIGRQGAPVRNMAVGVVMKIVINYILVGIPSVNVKGAPVGTVVCYTYIFIANLYCLCKYSNVSLGFKTTLIKPLVAGIFCGGAAWASYGLIGMLNISPSRTTLLSILIAGIVYLISLGLLRAIAKEDILMLPKGQKIAQVLEKIGWIG